MLNALGVIDLIDFTITNKDTIFSFQILHSTCLDFQSKLEAAQDLDEMLRCHNEYLSSIYKRCLLHHKVILIREALAKVLNLVIVCVHKWREGIDKIRWELP